jgi:hypothetical protein
MIQGDFIVLIPYICTVFLEQIYSLHYGDMFDCHDWRGVGPAVLTQWIEAGDIN